MSLASWCSPSPPIRTSSACSMQSAPPITSIAPLLLARLRTRLRFRWPRPSPRLCRKRRWVLVLPLSRGVRGGARRAQSAVMRARALTPTPPLAQVGDGWALDASCAGARGKCPSAVVLVGYLDCKPLVCELIVSRGVHVWRVRLERGSGEICLALPRRRHQGPAARGVCHIRVMVPSTELTCRTSSRRTAILGWLPY